ncbi:MAG: tail fiber domain-containing protein [Cryomorphaceae bacterium]|nr:tail fiber domain-containing protein [Flavobacteriales bacterium]
MNNITKALTIVACVLLFSEITAQATFNDNNTGNPGYLGWDSGVNFPLQVRHDGNQNIRFITNSITRMSLHSGWGLAISAPNSSNAQLKINQTTSNKNLQVTPPSSNTQLPVTIGAQFRPGDSDSDYGLNAESFFSLQLGQANTGAFAIANWAERNFGLFATACSENSNLAGYFAGDVVVTGAALGPSDENLKTSIESLNGQTYESLINLPVHNYFFSQEDNGLNLPEVEQYGFIAQEVDEVFPNIVKSFDSPVMHDEDGEIEKESISFKSLNHQLLIPLLIDAYKIQDTEISANQEKLNNLKERLFNLQEEIIARTENLQNSKISESSSLETLKVYPNPTTNQAKIEIVLALDEKVQISLESSTISEIILPKRMLNKSVTYIEDLRTDNIEPGLYVIKVLVGEEIFQRKLIIR